MNPGQSVKDRPDEQMILRGRSARRHQAGRARRRKHCRQHRHRARAGRQRARLSHPDRDPRDAEPGEEGHAHALRRRAGRGAGAALQQSRQLPARRAPACGGTGQERAERCAVRRPVEQPRQSQGALRLDRAGNLAPDRRQGRRLHLRDRHRRHDRRRLDLSAREEERHRDRRRRSARRRDVQPVRPRRGEAQRRRLDHGRHRARPRHADHRGHQGRQGLSHSRRGGGADHLRSARARGPLPRRFAGINVAGAIRLAKELGPGHTIVTVLCDSGTRYQSKLFNPDFLREQRLPVPAWLRAARSNDQGAVRRRGM